MGYTFATVHVVFSFVVEHVVVCYRARVFLFLWLSTWVVANVYVYLL